mmetsp:Transcript_23017/g.33974  ORF Transcript_23017/g.33974 Transcript_23017/m.33974 type:complete len:213 (-) Transcript_23017:927-1565(-)
MNSPCLARILLMWCVMLKSFIKAFPSARLRGSFSGTSLRIVTRQQQRRNFLHSKIIMMPEGPEVKTVVDQLQGGVGMRFDGIEFFSGRYTRHGTPTGFEEFCRTMTKEDDDESNFKEIDLIKEWKAKGKFIYIVLDDGKKKQPEIDDFKRSIWITLGMSGRFVSESLNGQQSTTPRWAIQLHNAEKKAQVFLSRSTQFWNSEVLLLCQGVEG